MQGMNIMNTTNVDGRPYKMQVWYK